MAFLGPFTPMTASLTLDKAGRIVLPKRLREKLHLEPGAKLQARLVGDHIEISEAESEVQIVQKSDGLPAIVGWKGFDAARAVREMREDQVKRLSDSKSR